MAKGRQNSTIAENLNTKVSKARDVSYVTTPPPRKKKVEEDLIFLLEIYGSSVTAEV